jgi:hypothetical protein
VSIGPRPAAPGAPGARRPPDRACDESPLAGFDPPGLAPSPAVGR